METLVQDFNKLSRPQKTPTGLPNHWYFSVRHVDLSPPGDLVHLVHPASRYVRCEGPGDIISLSSLAAKAGTIVPLLLKSFVQGDGSEKGAPKFAPWTWGTNCDPELARAVEARLKWVGVKAELCTLQLGNEEDEKISNEAWSGFFAALKQKAGGEGIKETTANRLQSSGQNSSAAACGTCKRDQASLSSPMKRCTGCTGQRYCSRECQKADWKQHKKVCGKSNNAPASENSEGETSFLDKPTMSGFNYYNNVASTIPAAQKLARSLNLTLPEPGSMEGIMPPIRRLVITGKDTPENLELFFGPLWKEGTENVHEEVRMYALMQSPSGSPAHTLNSYYDKGCPSFSPRPATSAELEKFKEMQEFQAQMAGFLNQ